MAFSFWVKLNATLSTEQRIRATVTSSPASDSPSTTLADAARCPCLSGETYGACCGPLHRGLAIAPTAERLMRSRYSAFAVGDAVYLLATWDPALRPDSLNLDEGVRWYRLDIIATERGGMLDTTGIVEFRAHYRDDGGAHTLHERSTFSKQRGRWLYVMAL
ncbi:MULTISPECIES: YchJ family protein [unclassified Frondihabitans]|uniref:YchJ family protein n=1 Tax=unclassified Frondihabitans TaxID=2626248 RepID=UPI000F4FAE26